MLPVAVLLKTLGTYLAVGEQITSATCSEYGQLGVSACSWKNASLFVCLRPRSVTTFLIPILGVLAIDSYFGLVLCDSCP
ncbi:Hypothetical protein NTJ_12905 [Nesidiocoris tenuis]|uniref:Uncharacterized protein n=1 Tax=Nesidiocoris tenuis TaxID=355587 RepID=A0ABN7B775_9HEMI|nr:Hypothetical protein NTJ_12905 [Nesidiocoris tenuis]